MRSTKMTTTREEVWNLPLRNYNTGSLFPQQDLQVPPEKEKRAREKIGEGSPASQPEPRNLAFCGMRHKNPYKYGSVESTGRESAILIICDDICICDLFF